MTPTCSGCWQIFERAAGDFPADHRDPPEAHDGVADSLYGISMRGDGVSNVVSQRLREREPA